jgi:hypothetical protein
VRSKLLVTAGVLLALTACQDQGYQSTRHLDPIPPATMALMSAKGMQASDPILLRSYKKESELEVWKMAGDGKYALLKTFPICRWSGRGRAGAIIVTLSAPSSRLTKTRPTVPVRTRRLFGLSDAAILS